MRALLLLLLLICCLSFRSASDDPYPDDYFQNPVAEGLRLSGTFGELRTDHFHAGIDIRGGMGVPILAAAEGEIVRVKVQAGGYGNVLYMAHPNGYTTVYAHLDRFEDEIAAYVKEQQYAQQSFEVDVKPPSGRFTFSGGARIGRMGTTGHSFGPHLHFEIRDSKTEEAINPLLFGFSMNSGSDLRIHELKVYGMDAQKHSLYMQSYSPSGRKGQYRISGDTILVPTRKAGLALKAYDHMNNGRNWNGVYRIRLLAKGQEVYSFEMDDLKFNELRYINAHLDYEEQKLHKSYFNRCFKLPGNESSIYETQVNDGILELPLTGALPVLLTAENIEGEKVELQCWLKYDAEQTAGRNDRYNYEIPFGQALTIDQYYMQVTFPEATFYEDVFLRYDQDRASSHDTYAAIHRLHEPSVPVHRYFTLAIRPDLLPDSLKHKTFIAYIDEHGDVTSYGGKWRAGLLEAKVRQLGPYTIMVDTEAPAIRPEGFRKDMRSSNRIRFEVTDNVGTGGAARGLQYRATIDGQWVLLEYDAKNDRMEHTFEGHLGSGTHIFRLEVTDFAGNTAVWEKEFLH